MEVRKVRLDLHQLVLVHNLQHFHVFLLQAFVFVLKVLGALFHLGTIVLDFLLHVEDIANSFVKLFSLDDQRIHVGLRLQNFDLVQLHESIVEVRRDDCVAEFRQQQQRDFRRDGNAMNFVWNAAVGGASKKQHVGVDLGRRLEGLAENVQEQNIGWNDLL